MLRNDALHDSKGWVRAPIALGRAGGRLLGDSYGGVIAVAVAQRHPELVRRLVLVEPSVVEIVRDQPDLPKMLADGTKWSDEKLALVRGGQSPDAVVRGFYDHRCGPTRSAVDLPTDGRPNIIEAQLISPNGCGMQML